MKDRVQEFIKHPRKALVKLSIPTLIAMFVQTLYNLVDTAWVGRLGAESLAAVTFGFPIFFILISINSGIGIGMGQRISRLLGERNKEEAENTAMHGLLISVIAGLLILIIGQLVVRQLFIISGAEGEVLKLSLDYINIILYGAFLLFLSYSLNSIFAAQGDTRTPMKVQVSALVLNAILDPIFIYTFDMGVKGAAVATVISLIFSIILYTFFFKDSHLKIHRSSFRFRWKIIKEVLTLGVPASLMMFLMSAYLLFLTSFMAHHGTDAVAAFGIASRLESLAIMPLVAISFSTTTLVAMFLGAKRYDKMKRISYYALKLGILLTTGVAVLFFIFARPSISIFTESETIIDIGVKYMRVEVWTYPLMAIGVIVARIAQGLGRGMPGLAINVIRIAVVAVPLAWYFTYILQLSYLWIAIAMVAGGLVSAIIAFFWLRMHLKKISSA